MFVWSPASAVAAALLVLPFLALAFAGERFIRGINRLPTSARLAIPAMAALPYYLVVRGTLGFYWSSVVLYAALPVALVTLLWHAAQLDPEQHGNWRDFA